MRRETIIAKKAEIRKKIEVLQEKDENLTKELIDKFAEHKVGDKAYILKVSLKSLRNPNIKPTKKSVICTGIVYLDEYDEFVYQFNGINDNGTVSKHRCYLKSDDKIEWL